MTTRTGDADREELLRLQRLLLPATLPALACTEVAAAYRADNNDLQIGGDWFDVIDRSDSQTVVAVIGDVVGHGLEQIAVMGQLRAATNALAMSLINPHEIVAGIDKFAASLAGTMATTLAVVVIDGSTTARICSAGHPPPVRVQVDGTYDPVNPSEGKRPPLGIGHCEVDGTFNLETDDLLVMYTDGVVERRDTDIFEQIDALGLFVQSMRDEPCHKIARAVVDDFSAGAPDDRAVVVLRPRLHRGDGYRLDTPQDPSVVWIS